MIANHCKMYNKRMLFEKFYTSPFATILEKYSSSVLWQIGKAFNLVISDVILQRHEMWTKFMATFFSLFSAYSFKSSIWRRRYICWSGMLHHRMGRHQYDLLNILNWSQNRGSRSRSTPRTGMTNAFTWLLVL